MSDRVPEIPPELIARATAGHDDALEQLVGAVYGSVRRWALLRTGDAADADDLTQDVLIRMIRRLDSYHGDAAFGTWLHALTRNAAIDRARSRARKARLHADPRALEELSPAPAVAADKLAHSNEVTALIGTFFEELPERQREVFDLVELQGIPAKETAELLGIEPVSVRANLFKARRRLRARILEVTPEIVEDVR